MGIASTDIKFYLSGGATNTLPASALGGAISSTEATDLFDSVSPSEARSGDTEYRGVYVKNTHATDTAYAVKLWILTNTASEETEVTIALCDEGNSAAMETIADDSTAPDGPSFGLAPDQTNALSLGNLAAGEYYGFWLKRVIGTDAQAYPSDGATIEVKASTGT